jgi:hypothetical protein
MPLAGLVLNRTHPVLAPVSAARARAAAEQVGGPGSQIAAAVLRLHADRADLHRREEHLLTRFSAAHPSVPVRRVPALAGDIADLDGLRRVGDLLAGATPAGAAATVG